MLFQSAADPDGDFNGAVADPGVVAEAWAVWRDEIAFAERYVAGAPDFDHRATAASVPTDVAGLPRRYGALNDERKPCTVYPSPTLRRNSVCIVPSVWQPDPLPRRLPK